MKRIFNVVAGACALVMSLSMAGCSDFLDTSNLYQKNTSNFYKTKADFDEAVTGIYQCLYSPSVNCYEHIQACVMGDLMLGGGGTDDLDVKLADAFETPKENIYQPLWQQTYKGVARCNALIENIANADMSKDFASPDDADNYKNEKLAEAYFMRGFLMFRAARFLGGLPIIPSSTAPKDVPRASLEETYTSIAADMVKAVDLFNEIDITTITPAQTGHANKWVAKAMLARIYLYYTGYMTNIEKSATDVLPCGEGKSVDKATVAAHLQDVISKSGYELASDFRNLWAYSSVNDAAKKFDPAYDPANPPYKYAADNDLHWVGQHGPAANADFGWTGNKEAMFSTSYGFGQWRFGVEHTNWSCLFFGIRGCRGIPFSDGWGWGIVHSGFYNDWDDADIRKQGSVLDMNNPYGDENTNGYVVGKNSSAQETKLFNKKYIALGVNGPDKNQSPFYYFYAMPQAHMQLNHGQDYVMLRFADVLLMHSELTGDAGGLNAVRARAGLDPVDYSLDAIKQERKYELAFEAIRWFDLLRWGDVGNDNSNNYYGASKKIKVFNNTIESDYSVEFRPETKGLVKFPENEILLSGGVYEQNPGW